MRYVLQVSDSDISGILIGFILFCTYELNNFGNYTEV
jgi:hypothetical protein